VILLCSLCGFIVAGITYATWKPTYSSTAKLYISDIIEAKPPSAQDPGVIVTHMGNSGNVLDSELEILNSLDNLKNVAETITPARILSDYVKGTNFNVDQAAAKIKENLTVESPRNSQIIFVTFSSRSLNLVQPVLGQVITNYIAAHINIHTPPKEDWATREHYMREADLKATEDQLVALKDKAQINDVEAEKAAYNQQEGFFQQQYYMAQAELQESTAMARQLEKLLPTTNQAAATNPATGATAFDPVAAYNHEVANIEGLKAKTNEFAKLLRTFAERGTYLNHLQVLIEDLERVKAMQEDYLKQVASQLNASKLEVALGQNRGANISIIQNPSPPASDARKSDKPVGTIAAGGVALGFGLAFLWALLRLARQSLSRHVA